MASHTALARRHGWTDEQLEGLWDFQDRPDFTAAEKAALELTERVTRDPHSVDDEFWNKLTRYYDEGEIVELVSVVAIYNFANRFNIALRVDLTKY